MELLLRMTFPRAVFIRLFRTLGEWTGPHIATVQEVFSPALHGRLERSNLTNQIKVSVNMWEYPKENSPR